MPANIARGVAARQAFDRWQASQHRHGRMRPPGVIYSAPEQIAPMPIGTGVWVRCDKLRQAGCEWLRAQITAVDPITNRYHVVNIDEPRAQWYARRVDIQPRYVGEVEPGIACPDAINRHRPAQAPRALAPMPHPDGSAA